VAGSLSSAERQGAAKGSSSAGAIPAGRWPAVRVEWSGRFSSSRRTSGCPGLKSGWAVAVARREQASCGGIRPRRGCSDEVRRERPGREASLGRGKTWEQLELGRARKERQLCVWLASGGAIGGEAAVGG
jgi:hypothetical protein